MENYHQRVVLITGASSGFGKAVAEHLHQRGYRVYGTSRGAEGLSNQQSVTDRLQVVYPMIPLDVTSDESVERGVEFVLSREGRLDIVINNAGYGLAGPVEDTSLAEAIAQFETNFFGMARVCRAVLPGMRNQGFGYLISVSSIGGLIGIPFQGFYSASKFAMEGLMELLHSEVKSYGIRVVLIEPGDFHTNFTVNRRKVYAVEGDSIYKSQFIKTLAVMERDELHGPPPEQIGPLVEKIITTDLPQLRYVIGPLSERMIVFMKRVLPSTWLAWLIRQYYQIK